MYILQNDLMKLKYHKVNLIKTMHVVFFLKIRFSAFSKVKYCVIITALSGQFMLLRLQFLIPKLFYILSHTFCMPAVYPILL